MKLKKLITLALIMILTLVLNINNDVYAAEDDFPRPRSKDNVELIYPNEF